MLEQQAQKHHPHNLMSAMMTHVGYWTLPSDMMLLTCISLGVLLVYCGSPIQSLHPNLFQSNYS